MDPGLPYGYGRRMERPMIVFRRLRKAEQPDSAFAAPDGSLTAKGVRLVSEFARVVERAYGGQRVRRGDVAASGVLRGYVAKLREVEPLLMEILLDPATRRMYL